MPKRSKVAVLDPTPLYDGGIYGEAKSQSKFQTLMQDYHELQREAFVTKNRLDEAKQRKLMLTAEVRFLRSRYNHLIKVKNMNALRERNFVQSLERTKILKQKVSRKESHLHRLPPIPERSKKKRKIIDDVTIHDACTSHDQHLDPTLPAGQEAPRQNVNPSFNMNKIRKANIRKGTVLQNSAAAALRDSSGFNGREGYLSSRVPVFDLNEISTGDEEFPTNVEAVKLFPSNDDLHKDLMLSVCRNTGEALSGTGKRKITWKDPVALRV